MRIVGPHLAELLEYLWLILGGNPNPGVTDRYLYRTVCLFGFDSNPSALWSEFHRVGKQIEENLFDLALISNVVTKTLVNTNLEVDAVLYSSLAHKRASIVDGQGQIERCQLQFHAPGLDLGEIENLVDQR